MLSQSTGRYASSLIAAKLQVQDSGGCMHRTETELSWYFSDKNRSAGVRIGENVSEDAQQLCLPVVFAKFSSTKKVGLLYVVLRPLPRGIQPIEEYNVRHILEVLREFNPRMPIQPETQAKLEISFSRQSGKPLSHTATELFLKVIQPLKLCLHNDKLPTPVFEHKLFEKVGKEWLLPGEALAAKFYRERS